MEIRSSNLFLCARAWLCCRTWTTQTLLENRGLRVSGGSRKLFMEWVETTLSQTGSLTLPQLCQNYMSLCVRIGKIDRLRLPLNA